MGILAYTLTQADLNTLNNNKCKLVFSGTDMVVGGKISNGFIYFGRKKDPSDPFTLLEIGVIDRYGYKHPFNEVVIEGEAYKINTSNIVSSTGGTATISSVYVTIGANTPSIYKFTKDDIDNINNQKCSLFINNKLVTEGTVIQEGDIVKISQTNTNYLVNIVSVKFNEINFNKVGDSFELVTPSTPLTNFSLDSFLYIHIINDEDINNFTDNMATFFINDVRAFSGDFIKASDNLKFIAYEGREIRELGACFRTTIRSEYFDVNEDGSIATLFLNPTYYGENYYRGIDIETWQTRPDLIGGYNNVYKIDGDTFKELIKLEFKEGELDLSTSIIGCINLPFKIPSNYILNNEEIVLGEFKSGINGDLLFSDKLGLELGTIKILPKYNDFRDYVNTNYTIQVPYSDNIDLPINYAVNADISVKYIINLYNGECIINVYSSLIDGVLISRTINLNIGIPLVLSENSPTDIKNIVLGGFNDINSFRIIKSSKILLNGDDEFNAVIKDCSPLTDYKGYIEFENIDLIGVMTSYENTLLTSILKQGVFIK